MVEEKKILIIEDEAIMRELYEKVLVNAGFLVEFAFDGFEGIKKVKEKKYDLVLLDIMLPKLTGLDVLKELRKEKDSMKTLKIYMLSNLGQESIVNEAMSLGANGYFIKARYLPEELVSKIKDVLLH